MRAWHSSGVGVGLESVLCYLLESFLFIVITKRFKKKLTSPVCNSVIMTKNLGSMVDFIFLNLKEVRNLKIPN